MFMNLVSVANLITILMKASAEKDAVNINWYLRKWVIIQFCWSFVLLIEVITDVTVSGFYVCYSTRFRIWPETLC